MIILRSWLNEFYNLKNRTDTELAETLENLGHEVERVTRTGLPPTVIVGEVLDVQPHPNADRLQVAKINIGKSEETIVCGAPNIATGQKVAVALSGTTLPNGLTIEKRALRGVESNGMICAADELGLGSDHNGILVLPDNRTVGEPLQSGNEDTLFELSITPNRGDVLSYTGISRELAAKWQDKEKIQQPTEEVSEISNNELAAPEVIVEAPVLCPQYTLRELSKIEPGNTPPVLTQRLKQTGHGIYGPIVDITNYVMEELGVPLHAFDRDKVTLPIVVRRAHEGEKITLLDGNSYTLNSEICVIADQVQPLAIAGIMGGIAAAVTPATKNILLESAYFSPTAIRRARTLLGINSDAAYRFERGTDPEAIEKASDRAAALLREHHHAIISPLTTIGTPTEKKAIISKDSTQKINKLLGTDFDSATIHNILSDRLGIAQMPFQTIAKSAELIGQGATDDSPVWVVPSWRHDIGCIEDLAEEIARIYGYDALPRTQLETGHKPVNIPDDIAWLSLESLKDQLADAGWTEHIGSSFISRSDAEDFQLDPTTLVELANPVSEEAAYLRPNLQLSVLKVIAKNPIFSELNIFEMGTVWKKEKDKIQEQTILTLVWTGSKQITIPGQSKPIGQSANKLWAKRLKIRRPVMWAEISLDNVTASTPPCLVPPSTPQYHPVSRYQATLRDIAMLVNQSVQPKNIINTLNKIPRVTDIELFDQFSSDKLPQDTHSLAFHLLLEDPNHTLTSEEIEETMASVRETLIQEFQAIIR